MLKDLNSIMAGQFPDQVQIKRAIFSVTDDGANSTNYSTIFSVKGKLLQNVGREHTVSREELINRAHVLILNQKLLIEETDIALVDSVAYDIIQVAPVLGFFTVLRIKKTLKQVIG